MQQPIESLQRQIITHLKEQEQRCVDKLSCVVQNYLMPLQELSLDVEAPLSSQMIAVIFSNIVSLRDAQRTLLQRVGAMLQAKVVVPPLKRDSDDKFRFEFDVVLLKAVFADPPMMHFLAEHTMFVIQYTRQIAPLLLAMRNRPLSKEIDPHSKFVSFCASVLNASTTVHCSLPEVDPLAVLNKKPPNPIDNLLLLLAAPLSAVQRYSFAARCLLQRLSTQSDAGGDISGPTTLLREFVSNVSERIAQAQSLVLEQVCTLDAAALISKFDNFSQPSLCESRVLLHRGTLVKTFARGRHERSAFLFSDIFCYGEMLTNGRYRMRGQMSLSTNPPLDIIDIEDSFFEQLENAFELKPPEARKRYIFFASSAAEKKNWISALLRAIEMRIATVADFSLRQPQSRDVTRVFHRLGAQNAMEQAFAVGSTDVSKDKARSPAMSRHALRSSYDCTTWSQMSTAHLRVFSIDISEQGVGEALDAEATLPPTQAGEGYEMPHASRSKKDDVHTEDRAGLLKD